MNLNKENYKKMDILKIEIDESCLETEPCYHYVKILYNNGQEKQVELDGVEIYELMCEIGMSIPEHFKQYNNYTFAEWP